MPGSSYATPTDLTTLGVSASALTGISTPNQQQALDAASQLADGYLSARFKLPLSVWGQDLRKHVCAIATYDLLVVRGYNPADGADTNIRDRYEDAVRWLERVSKQEVTPVVTDSSAVDSQGDPGGAFTAQATVMTSLVPGGGPASVRQTPAGIVVVAAPSLRGW